ncbi:flagellar hook-basal body complex protein FliE [Desulfocurvibacter africanus]|uniref:flagellar hook-basal body complex protein FliE n=1 Tax=Desulfocurvibacter africanus TaxID=873 RepID=UPI002FD95CE7
MSVSNVAMKAYSKALDAHKEAEKKALGSASYNPDAESGFTKTMNASLKKVNDLQLEKNSMVEAFASGENQNVHELMIQIQKAGLAINMTSAVRNKIMTAYQEIMRMSF